MPSIRTHRISAGSLAASRPRSIWPSTGIALALTAVSHAAHAVPTRFEGLVQAAPPYQTAVPLQNNLFERQLYHAAGARVSFDPWVWDPVAREWVYAVAPGESWSWWWRDTRSGQVIAVHSVRFEGGEALCWSNGFCGPAGGWWAAVALRCMPEQDRYRVETYHDGNFLGADEFRPTRFVPKVAQTFLPESLEPKRTRSASGESADIAAYVTDDIDCARPLPNARVRLTATVVGGTNGQGYFAAGDIGTGKFTSLGYNAVLNPGGAHENDTVIEGDTNAHGLFIARYQAQEHGAEEKIAFAVRRPATATDPAVAGASVEEDLRIAIPGLVRITHDNGLLAFRDSGSCPHDPPPHWLTPNTRSRVIALAGIYHQQIGRLLSLNDGSLPLGGVIARRRVSEAADRCHGSHRQGVDIDFNSHDRQVGEPGQEPVGENMRVTTVLYREENVTLLRYLDHIAERLHGRPFHGTSSIHYRFPD